MSTLQDLLGEYQVDGMALLLSHYCHDLRMFEARPARVRRGVLVNKGERGKGGAGSSAGKIGFG